MNRSGRGQLNATREITHEATISSMWQSQGSPPPSVQHLLHFAYRDSWLRVQQKKRDMCFPRFVLFCRRNAKPWENAKPLQQAKRAFLSCQAPQRICPVKLTRASKLFVFGKTLEDTIIYSRLHYSVSYLATLSWSVKLRARLVMPLYVKLLYCVSLPSPCSGVMTTSCPYVFEQFPVLRLTERTSWLTSRIQTLPFHPRPCELPLFVLLGLFVIILLSWESQGEGQFPWVHILIGKC